MIVQAIFHKLLSAVGSREAWFTLHALDEKGRTLAVRHISSELFQSYLTCLRRDGMVSVRLNMCNRGEADYRLRAFEWRCHGEARLPEGARRLIHLPEIVVVRPGDQVKAELVWALELEGDEDD